MIDLHTHTTASDGTSTPSELVQIAAAASLTAVGITDHDTVEGLSEALAAAEKVDVAVVPGTEISIDYARPVKGGRPGYLHLLVYELDPDGPLARELKALQEWRQTRNHRIVEKLNALGLPIGYEEVVARSGGGQVGRPHFAGVLVDRGYVRDLNEAFERYLAKGAPAYEEKRRLSVAAALDLARREGAVPVLAHPVSLRLPDDELAQRLAEWQALGLQGVEVLYPRHDSALRSRLGELARDLGLLATGGSDYHGDNKPNVALGSGVDGNLSVPDEVLHALRALRDENRRQLGA